MRVLLLGGGGREHAIGWKLAESPALSQLIAAPGNPGLASLGAVLPDLDISHPPAVVAAALANAIDLVVIGPEGPLALGIVDALAEAGIPAFGPTAAGARLEASKAYAKEIMRRAGVPTGEARTFTEAGAAGNYLRQLDGPYVVKADGLAAGKGVLVTEDVIAAEGWVRFCLEGHFGEAGSTVIVEEYLAGEELSVLAICDGQRAVALEPARDYKRLLDDGRGPNTGGMGCYSPVGHLPEGLVDGVLSDVIDPVLAALRDDGVTFKGFLYAGIMLTDEGPKVLEFNTRLGDPETQVLLPRLEDDLVTLLASACAGNLDDTPLEFRDLAAVDVVLAAAGYPENPERGARISGLGALERRDDVLVFHAGTKLTADGPVTNGGRVVNVVGLGADQAEARRIAYDAAHTVEFAGKHMRTDIAKE